MIVDKTDHSIPAEPVTPAKSDNKSLMSKWLRSFLLSHLKEAISESTAAAQKELQKQRIVIEGGSV